MKTKNLLVKMVVYLIIIFVQKVVDTGSIVQSVYHPETMVAMQELIAYSVITDCIADIEKRKG